MPSKKKLNRSITIYLDPVPGLTLKTLYDICVYAGDNYKELSGLAPLLRHECGLGIPVKHHMDDGAVHKIKLNLGWNRGMAHTEPCFWNIYIPENWREELPNHRLFNAGVNPKIVQPDPEISGWKEIQLDMDKKADAFARCPGRRGTLIKRGKVVLTLDCSYGNYVGPMPRKMFNSLKRALADMGLL